MKLSITILLNILIVNFLTINSYAAINQTNDPTIILESEINWQALNPKRGDASPRAGVLWGDITKNVASGFLVKFKDGFSSPPHIHNVTYRGVVISGLVHNDDPEAEKMWMPDGSFWTQPAGEAHITAATGENNIAYIEIDSGPYHVHNVKESFDNGERPVNIHPTNLIWLNMSDLTWLSQGGKAELAFLWGKVDSENLNGSFLKLPANFSGYIKTAATEFRAVIIKGSIVMNDKNLLSGSYFGLENNLHSSNSASLQMRTYNLSATEETIIYIRTNNKFKAISKFINTN